MLRHQVTTEQHYEDNSIKVWIKKNKKYPYHAFCLYKPNGYILEQAGYDKSTAVKLVMFEMEQKIKNKSFGGLHEESRN